MGEDGTPIGFPVWELQPNFTPDKLVSTFVLIQPRLVILGRQHLEFEFLNELGWLPRVKSGSYSQTGNPIAVPSSPTSFSCVGGQVCQLLCKTYAVSYET